jgi:hypothetical protein
MQTKKFSKIAVLALLAAVGLTSCSSDDTMAKPSDYEDKLVNFEQEVYNNVRDIVYDALREGSLASDVLDDVLYQFANSIVGHYNTVTAGSDEVITLKEAARSAESSDKTVADKFIETHKAYWSLDEDENHDKESEYAKVRAKWNTIEERIAERMHKDIAGGAYSERNLFSEKDFLVNLYSGLNNVANPFTSEVTTTNEGKIISPDVEPKDVFKAGLLNRDYYQTNYQLASEEDANGYTYVEDAVIPKIYQELLVEQYLLDETYNTLGRSYAREVNIVSIKSNDEYPLAATYLVNYFVDAVINQKGSTVTLETLKTLSNAWKGVDLNAAEKALLDGSKGFKTETINGETVYLGTEYGDLMEDYSKITDNPLTTNTSIESTFTNNGAYKKEVGLEIKSNEVALKDHTENGWYIKNGGLTNLPETIRTRLFNIGVANALDNEKTIDRFDANFDKDEESAYIATINGAHYLKVAETQGADEAKDILHYDADSKTYYIIQVVNATSTSKLSKESSNAYEAEIMEEIVNDVVRVVANNDSYKTLSTEHWLEEAGLEYHDTVVYDYFKENYPDLFD